MVPSTVEHGYTQHTYNEFTFTAKCTLWQEVGGFGMEWPIPPYSRELCHTGARPCLSGQ